MYLGREYDVLQGHEQEAYLDTLERFQEAEEFQEVPKFHT
jgi:hypothetical protein